MKKNKGFAAVSAVSAVIAVIHFIAAFLCIRRLPETVPLHFNAQWICDSMGSRWTYLVVAILPLVVAVVALAVLLTGKTEHPKPTAIAILLTELYVIGAFWLMYPTLNSGAEIGDQIDSQPIATILSLLLAAMFVIIGNYLPIIQPNKTFGLRVPWTLNNPQCWRLTHRFAGRVWVVTGLLLVIIELAALALHHAGESWTMAVVTCIIVVNVAVPCIFAYQHRND